MKDESMVVLPSLKGKTAVVTGAGSGIGRAAAILFAKNGTNLFLMSRNIEKLEETTKLAVGYGVKCYYRSTDVTDPIQVKESMNECRSLLGCPEILINDAGGSGGRKKITQMSGGDFDEVYKLNLKNVFLCCIEVLPEMIKRRYGKIVNVSSLIGRAPGDNTNIAYASMKAGIDQFSRYLAREVGAYGINVNSVSPGYIESSQRITDLWAATQDMDKVFGRLSIKRAGTAMEVANIIAFLAADESSYITGEVVAIDGGAVMS